MVIRQEVGVHRFARVERDSVERLGRFQSPITALENRGGKTWGFLLARWGMTGNNGVWETKTHR